MIKINAKLLAAVNVSRSTEETRYYLCGIYFDRTRIVATDGHVLTIACTPEMVLPDESSIRPISKQAFSAMKKTAAENVIIDNDILQVLDSGENVIHMEQCKAIDGTYPDYMRVVPVKSGDDCPGFFSSVILEKLIQTAKIMGENKKGSVFISGESPSSPHVVRYESTDLFTIAMPITHGKKTKQETRKFPAWLVR